ncbi:glycosyltransferase [Idiomarina piscisalsi]|uniref:Glycosyltransferase 2-like domain-containing protein n=1 Tax=Idiomarina piscisalsi TaxID=1096243 RepID=A0A432YRS3_9GAMM|nr:glycosyltransferase [Idiomarina piscisalsi]RUO64286.1 hypothetical protein CWI73_09010 [Idiomarina piscisalsi]
MTELNNKLNISVLMSVYDGDKPNWFDEALHSILVEQSPGQLVLVIDGTISEKLENIISKYYNVNPDVLNVIRLDRNKGLAHALNVGLRYCNYELVARMDADDISYPTRLKTQQSYFLKDTDLDILGSPAIDIDANGASVGLRGVPISHQEIYKLMWTCPLIHPSVMFKKDKILAAGGYSEKLKRRQDYELWFRCAELGYRFKNAEETLIKYRITEDTHKRNNLSVAWSQYKIGLSGVSSLGLGVKARLGVAFPVIKALLPTPLRKLLIHVSNVFDPRGRKNA